MRRRLAITLTAALVGALWVPPPPLVFASSGAALLLSVIEVPRSQPEIGGLSGIEVSADGSDVRIISDRGHIARGQILRDGDTITGVDLSDIQPMIDRHGEVLVSPHNDSEGLALTENGRVYISFELVHRVLYYDTWESAARWPSYTKTWRTVVKNAGMEALAIAPDGTLYAFLEGKIPRQSQGLVYVRRPEQPWEYAFSLPLGDGYAPVGADFGPDGRLYLLERKFRGIGFSTRVRAMTAKNTDFSEIETILHTGVGVHGNLEGLSVWQDAQGRTRLLMVSDDNFRNILRSEIVEYVLDDGVAQPGD